MLIAGLSEFLIIIALLWTGIRQPFSAQSSLRFLFLICLMITGIAASLGAIKYLTAMDTQHAHQLMTYVAKHFAMPSISLLTLHIVNHTFRQSRTIHKITVFLALSSVCSLVLNQTYAVGFISDGIIISSLLMAIKISWESATVSKYISMAVLCLISTLIWGMVINDQSIRIGFFHCALALFFFFLAKAYQGLATQNTKLAL